MRAPAALWLACAFSSAYLLFVVQPLLAKWLLPSFGGSPGTWAACMLFFQTFLLVGYGYAWLLSRLRPRAAFVAHALLCFGVAAFSLRAAPLLAPEPSTLSPALRIPCLLLQRAGLPYLLVASTAPLLQAWAAQLGATVPHRLYAVSNAGSLLGLFAYPWWIEATWPLPEQYAIWLWASAVFAVGSLCCAGIAATFAQRGLRVESHPPPIGAHDGVYWLACAFVPSLFLLAATDYISIDLAATPALWVTPLALYLLSFIAAFSGVTERLRRFLVVAWLSASVGFGYLEFAQGSARLPAQLGFVLGGLTLAALLCHDALVRARPRPEQLPVFYLWTAAGGALGGVYVSWLAPLLLRDYYELELACVLTYALLCWTRLRPEAAQRESAAERRSLFLGLGLVLPLLAAGVLARAGLDSRGGQVIERRRSWYGALRVTDLPVARLLTHGRIRHGMQLRDPARAEQPTMYFGPGTAVAQVLTRHAADRPRKLGIVGLGVGTLAAYGGPRDQLSFYELDPNVLDLAQRYFTFLRDTRASTRFVIGDGRVALSREPTQHFDVLVLDAFASDAVPAHLLTHEAFGLYSRQLAADGVLLANVSNRHLAVDRVVRAAARSVGLACEVVETPADAARFVSKVRWAVMARRPEQLARELAGLQPAPSSRSEVLWTDARASIWSIMK